MTKAIKRTKQQRMERYRLAQAQKMLDLFEDANGRPARTVKELGEWLHSPRGRAASAYDRTKDGKIIPDADQW